MKEPKAFTAYKDSRGQIHETREQALCSERIYELKDYLESHPISCFGPISSAHSPVVIDWLSENIEKLNELLGVGSEFYIVTEKPVGDYVFCWHKTDLRIFLKLDQAQRALEAYHSIDTHYIIKMLSYPAL